MKKSTFDLEHQNSNIESKIITSLERVSQAFRVLLWNESKEFSLSPIQVQVLIFLLHHTEQMRKVSYLADEFNMTKATISETIKTLEQKQLIKKAYELNDSRSYVIHLTKKGKIIAKETSLFANQMLAPIDKLNSSEIVNLFLSLMDIIFYLNKSGVITIQRMCYTCCNFKENKKGQEHFCKLLNTSIPFSELRIDCEEHRQKVSI